MTEAAIASGSAPAQAVAGLDVRLMASLISPILAARMRVLGRVDSTQRVLLETAATLPDRSWVLSDHQEAGRGRRGRAWLTPPGAALALSMLAHSPNHGRWPGALSLALGVAAAEVVRDLGVPTVQLKWPNDLWVQGRKLGGILVETCAVGVVAGVGINRQLPAGARASIDQACTDLAELGVDAAPEFLAAALAEGWNEAFDTFARCGWDAFHARWDGFDGLAGKRVRVLVGVNDEVHGMACGVDAHGYLRVEVEGETKAFSSAEVSVRAP
ncbi:MAG TPA: biotin--[acetyl-CoA-carboxylase] ligase [Chiayiivirga sp.]|nr:biotin--[acetyl-CoA-carboxylase] ligase [Chiayiivirga sp.]